MKPAETPTAHNRIAESHETNGRSVVALVKELRDETTLLFRQEIALAKTEMSEKASRLSRNAAYIAAGAAIATAGCIALMIAAIGGLYAVLVAAGMAHMTAGWLSPLILGVVVLAIGYVLVQMGVSSIREESVVPEHTAESLQENKDWIKDKVTQ